MKHHVAVVAQIRPGKRDEVVRVLEKGPPFDLESHGFRRHEAFLGDTTLVLVFEGEHALTNVHKLAASLPLANVMRLGTLVSRPQVLSDSWTWDAEGVSRPERASA
jgi:hypothetical protein